MLCDKAEALCKPKLHSVHLLERHAEEGFKVIGVHSCAVRRPEQPVDHSLPPREAERQRGRKAAGADSFTVGVHIKGIDLELLFEKARGRAAETEEVIPGHGRVACVRLV